MDKAGWNIYKEMIEELKMVYLHDKRPWMIGFSGGKDSTLLCCLIFEMLASLKPKEIHKKIYVVSSDTMVENPIVCDYMNKMSKLIGRAGYKYKIESHIIKPPVEKTFWTLVIGLGYPTPEPPGFRWCTDKLKIKPINEFTINTIRNDGEIVMLLGVRKAESSYRARGIKAREIEGKLLIPHTDIENAYMYNPLTEIPNEKVWEYLLKDDGKTPWGSDNKYLFSLYQGESLGEEQSVLGEVDKDKVVVTGNSRFGCWVCTMVKEDKSLKNFIDKGAVELKPLRDFRNWLLEFRNKTEYRENKRRNGAVYLTNSGERGQGPFTLEGRAKILSKLLNLELKTGMKLITEEELRAIDRCWEEEGDLSCRKLVDLYSSIKGEKLPWDDYRAPKYSSEVMETLYETSKEFDISMEMVSKLIIAIDKNKHYSNGKKVTKAFDKVINEGWLHHDYTKKEKEKIEYVVAENNTL